MTLRAASIADLAVGSRIRQRRRSVGMTQLQVAEAIGVTAPQLHRYETGMTRIPMGRLISIASALNVRPETLVAASPPSHIFPADPESDPKPADDIAELVGIFSRIGDARHRAALVRVARLFSAELEQEAREEG